MGLLDYSARFYDPSIARFTSVDPLASQFASWNPYHYVHNNPMLLIDPDGRDTTFADVNAQNQFNSTYNKIQSRIDNIYSNEKWSDKKKARKASSYLKDRKVLDNIIESDKMFEYRTSNFSFKAEFGVGKDGIFRINLPKGASVEDFVYHESIHANQYLAGNLGFDENQKPVDYDYNDEVKEYNKQYYYAKKYLNRDLIIENTNGTIPNGTDMFMFQQNQIKWIIENIYGNKDYIIKEYKSYPIK